MRNIIIGLSIFFLSLSGIVTYKTLKIPSNNIYYQNNQQELTPKEPSPKTEDISKQLSKDQVANQAMIKQLQATNAKLEDNQSDKQKKPQADVETKGFSKGARVLAVFGNGTFRPGQFFIDDNLENAVQKLVPDIMASPDHSVIIEGHTDSTRPSAGKMDNTKLSFLRAKGISMILVKNGIPLERISVIGYGDTRPVVSNETIEGRGKNRRVEVKLIPGDNEF